jgi:hypothetical protein
MTVVYALLANLVVAAHLAFVAFVVLGGLLVLRWPRVVWLHLPCVTWGALVALMGWICPLTPLERALRIRAGVGSYGTSFLEHYVIPVLYPGALTRGIQIGLGVGVVVLNAAVYAAVWRRRQRVTRPPP